MAYDGRRGHRNTIEITSKDGAVHKSPGRTIFLTPEFNRKTRPERQLTVVHEMCHFVRPHGVGHIGDHAYTFQVDKFHAITKFQKLHNADSFAVFMLEFCIGTSMACLSPELKPDEFHLRTKPTVNYFGDFEGFGETET